MLVDGTMTVSTSASAGKPRVATSGSHRAGEPFGVQTTRSYHAPAGERSERSTPKTSAAIAVS
jgi:hypothetical protein